MYKIRKVKIYMYQYFKRQLKTPTCFRSFGINPQGVLNVLHWNYLWCFVCVVGVWQREIWTCGVCVCVWKSKSSVAVACFLPGRAKDLSAPLVDSVMIQRLVVLVCSVNMLSTHDVKTQNNFLNSNHPVY